MPKKRSSSDFMTNEQLDLIQYRSCENRSLLVNCNCKTVPSKISSYLSPFNIDEKFNATGIFLH